MNASLYAGRRRRNTHRHGAVARRDGVRARLAGADPRRAAVGRASAACRCAVFTEMTPPPGAAGGLLNADRRQPDHDGAGGADRHADRHPGRHLHGRIRPPRRGSPSVVRFINDILLSAPSIVVGLFIYEVMVVPDGPFLRLGRRGGARGDRHPGGGAHHRRHADAGAGSRCARRPPRSACRAR